jgi:hypothetical protein
MVTAREGTDRGASGSRWRGRSVKLLAANRGEFEKRVDEMLMKRARGEKLTKQEVKILAYGYYAADRRSVAVRVKPRKKD